MIGQVELFIWAQHCLVCELQPFPGSYARDVIGFGLLGARKPTREIDTVSIHGRDTASFLIGENAVLRYAELMMATRSSSLISLGARFSRFSVLLVYIGFRTDPSSPSTDDPHPLSSPSSPSRQQSRFFPARSLTMLRAILPSYSGADSGGSFRVPLTLGCTSLPLLSLTCQLSTIRITNVLVQ